MRETSQGRLLAADDPPPVEWFNRSGASPILLTGDHGGNNVPRKLASLGLPPAALARHIGWDIGVHALGRRLAIILDAAFVSQSYSRLVIDCNRDPHAPDAIPVRSDDTDVSGNEGLNPDDRLARIDEIHAPYHAAIAAGIAQRRSAGQPLTLIALHSFTPRMNGIDRPWHVGLLHAGHADGFSRRMLAGLRAHRDLVIGDNAPYRLDETDYSIPRHAFGANIPYAEIEVRQDLLLSADAVDRMAALLADCIRDAGAAPPRD